MRENLVIVRSGRRSLHPTWIAEGARRSFDLWTCPYEESPAGDMPGPSRIRPGGKWDGLAQILSEEPAWRDYAYVCLPDDDLSIDAPSLSRFFAICKEHDASLAQPALSEGSQYSHPITLRNRSFRARATTFVEIMAPCLRTSVLATLLPTLAEGSTGLGWGLDDAWARLLDYRGLWIVDEVTVVHDRPVGSMRGRGQRAALRQELRRVRRRFDACEMRRTLAGVDENGSVIPATSAHFLDAYLEGYRWLWERVPAVRARLLRDQARDPEAWLAGAPRRAGRGPLRRWWDRLLGSGPE